MMEGEMEDLMKFKRLLINWGLQAFIENFDTPSATMITRLTLFITFGGLFVTTVRSQVAAQGGASLADLIGQVNGAQNDQAPSATMITRITLFITSLFVTTDRSPAAAQGGASLADLIGQVNDAQNYKVRSPAAVQGEASLADLIGQVNGTQNDKDKEIIAQNIQDISVPPPAQSTTAPAVQPNSGGIPGVGSCTCVPYYLCSNDTKQEGDIRLNDGPCESYLEVCCNKDDLTEEEITPASIPKEKKSVCGFHHPDGLTIRKTSDKENVPQFGEFPWMVAVLWEEAIEGSAEKLKIYQCGGALIHPQVVVTAAHCFSAENRKYKARAGDWDAHSRREVYPHQDREVQTIVTHPEYYAGALYNDVALLYLESPLESELNIGTICLPPQGTITSTGLCYATGWGKDVFGPKGKFQVILKKIELPVVPNAECQAKLRTTRLGKFFELHKSFMCAGGEPGKDTCKGDGGSPLACPIPGKVGRYYQAGIVAWGIGCGENNTPGVYVNLSLFRDWIDSEMKAFGLDSSSYEY